MWSFCLPTPHALQLLDMSYFKPFKFAFNKEINSSMVRNNHLEPNKVTLTGWVNKALDQSLSKQNVLSGLTATWVWPLNPRAMDAGESFNRVWFKAQVKAIEERFHCNIHIGCKANLVGDTNGNYNIFIKP
jgi:hypothetical protein